MKGQGGSRKGKGARSRAGNPSNALRAKGDLDPSEIARRAVKQARKELDGTAEAMPPGRKAKLVALVRAAEKQAKIDRLNDKWRPWEGTPETNERIDRLPSRRRQSSIDRMHTLGKITADELAAAHEIASVVEMIERSVSVRCASLEARVDFAGSGRDALIESLGRVRMEVAYRAWREAIPVPRRMIIDMVLSDRSYVALSRHYKLNWRTARKRLVSALRLWQDCKEAARDNVRREDMGLVYARLGEGQLLPPKPRIDALPAVSEEAA